MCLCVCVCVYVCECVCMCVCVCRIRTHNVYALGKCVRLSSFLSSSLEQRFDEGLVHHKWSHTHLNQPFLRFSNLTGSQSYQTFFLRKMMIFSIFCYEAWLFHSKGIFLLCYKHSSLTGKIGKQGKTSRRNVESLKPLTIFIFEVKQWKKMRALF